MTEDLMPSHRVRAMARKSSAEIDLEKLSLDLQGFLLVQKLTKLASDLMKAGIHDLDDLMDMDPSRLPNADEEEQSKLRGSEVVKYRRRGDVLSAELFGNPGQGRKHFIFLSHCKLDAGTEAALMVQELCKMLKEDPNLPGASYETPVFLDSENLNDLKQLQEQVRNCQNLILMCTDNVLSSAWCLVEIVTAMEANVPILPLTVQKPGNNFTFPNNDFYERLGGGETLNETAMETMSHCGVTLPMAVAAVKFVFMTIALPYSPHKSKLMREAELNAVLARLQPPDSNTHGQQIGNTKTARHKGRRMSGSVRRVTINPNS